MQVIIVEIAYHNTLLPDPATKAGVRGAESGREEKERAFAVDPP